MKSSPIGIFVSGIGGLTVAIEIKNHMPNVEVRVVAIYRDKKHLIPNGDTIVLPDDDVFFLATEENMRFMSELRKSTARPHNVMIAGGGRVGSALAKKLESIYSIKLIEKDKYIAKQVAQDLSSTVVLNNDIADETLLNNENINEVILATSATVEGQTTAFYIQDSLKNTNVKISKLAQGLPVGGEIETSDDGTLISAFKNRRDL